MTYRAPTGYPEDWGMEPPDRVRVLAGDCREVIKTLADCSIDSVCTDPPYALVSSQKRFGKPGSAPAQEGRDGLYKRASAGFMGKQWDTGDVAFDPAFWVEVLRVLKPGGHVLAFGGTRTYHRLAVAIEDAGFEIRDQIGWCYASGFPKSHNISRNLEDVRCARDDQVRGLRQGADHAGGMAETSEDANMLATMQRGAARPRMGAARLQGTESENEGFVPESRDARAEEPSLEGRGDVSQAPRQLRERPVCAVPDGVPEHGEEGRLCDGTSLGDGEIGGPGPAARRVRSPRGSRAAEQLAVEPGAVAGQPEPQAGGAWPRCGRCGKPVVPDGLGTALKPAWEPIVLARKPLAGTVAETVLQHGTGALNIDGCRVQHVTINGGNLADNPHLRGTKFRSAPVATAFGREGDETPLTSKGGRWPANVIHDGSDEVVAAFPQAPGQQRALHGGEDSKANVYGKFGPKLAHEPRGDAGSAARFFYSAKADADDRMGSKHPTVKPVDLMAYLCRLVTPPGGLVLDPFAGSGTTGVACIAEGFRAILIEREPEYIADIEARIAWATGEGASKDQLKSRKVDEDKKRGDDLPLFGSAAQ